MCELCSLAAYDLPSLAPIPAAGSGGSLAATVGGNGKWGGAAPGTSGGMVTWSFATQNYQEQTHRFDRPITEPAYQADVRAAFQRWESVANIQFVEQADSAETDIRVGWDVMDGPGGLIGETAWWKVGSNLDWAIVRFDSSENYGTGGQAPGNGINFLTLALHEIGHAIGFPHDNSQSSIMNSRHSPTMLDLTDNDVAAAQLLYGTPAGASLAGGAGPDRIGPGAAPPLRTTYGDDVIQGGAGDDTIDGGTGRDLVVLSGARADYRLARTGEGWSSSGPDGNDLLLSIERLRFDDGTLVLDPADPAFNVHRLYRAALGREPDQGGLTAWTHAITTGTSLTEVAGRFTLAPEFTGKYGVLDNASFVQALYGNVLGRAGDEAGSSGWTHALNSGALGRAEVMLGFSDSAENIALVGAAIGDDGVWLA